MKTVLSAIALITTLVTIQSAQASKLPMVMHYVSCQEIGAPMFDAVAVNVDNYINPTYKTNQLKASVYHRVENGTILVSRTDVREQQARRPGAPKEFIGKDIRLTVQTTVAPGKNGFPGVLEMRNDRLQTKINVGCQFVR